MALPPPPIQAPFQDPKGGLNLQWAAWFRAMWQALRTGSFDLGIAWGTLTGTITDQQDLQVALNAKLSSGRQVATAAPLTGGGFLTADLHLGVDAATPVSLGVVRPDGVTITVNSAGVLSVIAGEAEPPVIVEDPFGNNTPAADEYKASTAITTIARNFDSSTALEDKSGNPNDANSSEQPWYRLIYDGSGAGVTVKPMVAIQPWWRNGVINQGHIDVGYSSLDAAQVLAQLTYLKDRAVNHGSIAWYGSANTHHDNVTKAWRDACVTDGTFKMNVRIQKDAILPGIQAGLSSTNALIAQLDYCEANYFQSAGYHLDGGRPVVLFFDVNSVYTDINWATVRAQCLTYASNPKLLFRNKGGYSQTESDGAFSWIDPNAADSDDRYGLGYVTDYNPTAIANGAKVQICSVWKGFDDVLATWGKGRYIPHDGGVCWMETWRIHQQYFPIGAQADYILIPTLNDYEEGTGIEMGIPNGVTVTASITAGTLNWTITGDEDTVYQYRIFEYNGAVYTELGQVAVGGTSFVIPGLAAGNHIITVMAEGQPFLQNRFSSGLSYNV